MVFGRQPAVWIGVIASCILAVVTTLLGQGIISDALAGRVTDLVNASAQILTILAPVIAGLVIRTQVTPVAAPVLPQGTKVTVVTPPETPNTTTTV